MGATTRASTGNSKPRILQQIGAAVAPKKRSGSGAARTKANTSKPRTTKVASGRVSKPKASSTTTTTTTTTKKKGTTKATAATGPKTVTAKKPRTKTEKAADAVAGSAKKVVGEVTGRPGKKAAGTAKIRGTDSTVKRAAPRTKKV